MPPIPRLRIPALRALLLLLAATAVTGAAQQAPRLLLDPPTPAAGSQAELRGNGMHADAPLRLAVEAPDGSTFQAAPRTDARGSFAYPITPMVPGEWTARVSGGTAQAELSFEVAEATPTPAEREEAGAAAGTEAVGVTEGDPTGQESTSDGTAVQGPTSDETAVQEATSDETAVPDGASPATAVGQTDTGGATTADQADGADGAAATDQADGAAATMDAIRETVGADETIGAGEMAGEAGTARPAARPDSFEVDGTAVVALAGRREAWRLEFPAGSGATGAVLDTGTGLWAGHGNSLLELDRATGSVLRRWSLPGAIVRIESTPGGVSVVSMPEAGLSERTELTGGRLRPVVRFGPVPEVFGWLEREAEVPDPAARLERDPTNPWLYARAALAAGTPAERTRLLAEAVERADTFYDLAGVARVALDAGEAELADRAMDLAYRDFASRGYRPELLTDLTLHEAYRFPLRPLRLALTTGDLETAGFWARWTYPLATPRVPATLEALEEYSQALRTAGHSAEASLWQERSRPARGSAVVASLDRAALALGGAGWYAVAAMIVAILALHLTLTAKYWSPQTLAMRRRRETGRRASPVARLFAIRFYSFTEKLVLALLFAGALLLLALADWNDQGGNPPPALGSGTLASPSAREAVADGLLGGQRGAYVRGYAAQASGEDETAAAEYRAAGDYPPALNNLGALTGNEALFQRALDLWPGLPEAAYNLGRAASPSPFHAEYLPGEPALVLPDAGDFRTGIAGTWQQAVGRTFQNPWTLADSAPFGLPLLAWQALLVLFFLWGAVNVLWLLVPRPRMARNAPRTPLYHVLALLVPGSGLADEAWGLLLIVPWALFSLDALSQVFGWPGTLGTTLETDLIVLGGIYLVNLVAFVVELLSYQRRMRALWRSSPEAAQAYGLRRSS